METSERAIVRIIAPIEVLAGVLLLASVATFAAMTANPAMDVPGTIERLGSMPVVLALFALVTATTLLDEQLSFLPARKTFVRAEVVATEPMAVPVVIALPETKVLEAEQPAPELPEPRDAREVSPWWAEWIAQTDRHPDLPAGDSADVIDLVADGASRPLVDLGAGRELLGS